jgi:BASS family bile acid:Na+ symporter
MDLKQLVTLAFQISLVLIVFGFGLRATLGDLTQLLRNPPQLVRSLVAMFVVMPVVVIGLVRAFDLPATLKICLVALAFTPVPPLVPKKLIAAGGREEYAYGVLTAFSVLAIVIVPLWAYAAARLYGRPLAISAATIAGIVTSTVVVPIAAGVAVRRFLPTLAARLDRPVAVAGVVLIAVATLVLVGGAWPALWALVGDGTLAAIVAFVGIGLVVGHVIGGPGLDERIVLALSCASRHPMIALALASAFYPGASFGGTILLYLLVSAIVCIPYIKWAKAHAAPAHVAGAGKARR